MKEAKREARSGKREGRKGRGAAVFLFCSLLAPCFPLPLLAQQPTANLTYGTDLTYGRVAARQIVCTTDTRGFLYLVTDGATPTSCNTGGSLGTYVLCVCDGTNYVPFAISGGGGGGEGTDANAIHGNTANEITAVPDKATPSPGDHLLIEDSGAGNAKKDITIGSIRLQDLSGAVTDAQVPNTITIQQAQALTDGNKGDFTCTTGNCVLNPLSVTLGIDTTGEYVAGVLTGQGLTKSGTVGASVGLVPCALGLILKSNGTAWNCSPDDTVGGGGDATAIHDDQANELALITPKAAPVAADVLLLEDSAAGFAKRSSTLGGLKTVLESVLALSAISGTVTDAQVPDTITIQQAQTLTDGDKGDFVCTAGDCQFEAGSITLGIDTSGDYVASATLNQGLLTTGTEGASLGLIPCSAGQLLKNVGGTSWACAADDAGAGGSDGSAIHEDQAGEIAAIADKATPVPGDHLLIEDSAAANAKKDITLGSIPLSILAGAVTDAQVPNTITITLAATATALAANGTNCAAGTYPLGTDATGAVEGCTPAAQTLACPGTDKLRAYNATTGVFTCATETIGTTGGDVTTATSLATCAYAGDTSFGFCTYTVGDVVYHQVVDAAKTTPYTSDIVIYASDHMHLINANDEVCQTIDKLTGLTTYHGTGDCARPVVTKPFDASAFSPGVNTTLDRVTLNGWPAWYVLAGPDSDAGVFNLSVPVLWDDYPIGGLMTLQLTCHSITNQNGLTLQVRVGAAVCVGDTETLPAFVAPTSGTPLTCTFGNQPQDSRVSNIVTLTTSGCVAGKAMHIPLVSEGDMTASWSLTTGLLTGGTLKYESQGTPTVVSYAPVTPVLDNCNRTEAGPMTNGGIWDGPIDADELGTLEATGTTCSKSSVTGAGSVYSTALYGPDMEAYLTIGSTATTGALHLYVRLTDVELLSPLGAEGIGAAIDEAADTLQLVRLDNGTHTAISALVTQETSTGDIVLLRAFDETISLIYCPGGINCVVKATATETTYLDVGRLGFRSNTQANTLDNFGGGTLP